MPIRELLHALDPAPPADLLRAAEWTFITGISCWSLSSSEGENLFSGQLDLRPRDKT